MATTELIICVTCGIFAIIMLPFTLIFGAIAMAELIWGRHI